MTRRSQSSHCRFIPACAGNTTSSAGTTSGWPVHPRVCGEHSVPRHQPPDIAGSSPRVRGTLCLSLPHLHRHRFIPACAGNTPVKLPAAGLQTVHPRVCGEHLKAMPSKLSGYGSSPRVRGTRMHRAGASASGRFIPACAGNTHAIPARRARVTVHPRVCGEHDLVPGQCPPDEGSSPRVRGTPWPYRWARRRGRFIPACAGNTHDEAKRFLYGSGSSPRVRGTR